jgi:hypothetical protein
MHLPADVAEPRRRVTDGCENPGKHPMTLNGHLDATVDHEIIEGWWGRHPTANVGIACGASRRVVLDVDPRHHGDDELAVLLAEEGQTLPETWTVGTSRGGSHVHLGWPAEIPNDPPPRFVRNLCPGVEVKAAGGYVVAPPSLHVTGDRYQFLIGAGPSDLRTPAMCPAWLWTRITREAAACDGTPSGPVACSLLGVLFEQHRLVRATLASEKWAVTCPWEAAHTAGRALSGTVLFGPPGAGRARRVLLCPRTLRRSGRPRGADMVLVGRDRGGEKDAPRAPHCGAGQRCRR